MHISSELYFCSSCFLLQGLKDLDLQLNKFLIFLFNFLISLNISIAEIRLPDVNFSMYFMFLSVDNVVAHMTDLTTILFY